METVSNCIVRFGIYCCCIFAYVLGCNLNLSATLWCWNIAIEVEFIKYLFRECKRSCYCYFTLTNCCFYKFDACIGFLKELDCLVAFLQRTLEIVLSLCWSNLWIGSTRRRFALDSTSSGRCTWTAVGYNSFGWRHLVYNVSYAFQPSEYSVTLSESICVYVALLL